MSVWAVVWAYQQLLPPREKFVLVVLADNYHPGHGWVDYPDIDRVASLTGHSMADVEAAIRTLAGHGYIALTDSQQGRQFQLAMPPPDLPSPPPRPKASIALRTAVAARFTRTCFWCHRRGDDATGPDGHTWHVGRLDPSEGYMDDNVVLACRRCNTQRGRMGDPLDFAPDWQDLSWRPH